MRAARRRPWTEGERGSRSPPKGDRGARKARRGRDPPPPDRTPREEVTLGPRERRGGDPVSPALGGRLDSPGAAPPQSSWFRRELGEVSRGRPERRSHHGPSSASAEGAGGREEFGTRGAGRRRRDGQGRGQAGGLSDAGARKPLTGVSHDVSRDESVRGSGCKTWAGRQRGCGQNHSAGGGRRHSRARAGSGRARVCVRERSAGAEIAAARDRKWAGRGGAGGGVFARGAAL